MHAKHPFEQRIQIERKVISLVNEFSKGTCEELTGTSVAAIESWYKSAPLRIQDHKTFRSIRHQLEYLGRTARITSNGSHRGAMIAPKPKLEIIPEMIEKLRTDLRYLFSK